jgi:hypothetical protein
MAYLLCFKVVVGVHQFAFTRHSEADFSQLVVETTRLSAHILSDRSQLMFELLQFLADVQVKLSFKLLEVIVVLLHLLLIGLHHANVLVLFLSHQIEGSIVLFFQLVNL